MWYLDLPNLAPGHQHCQTSRCCWQSTDRIDPYNEWSAERALCDPKKNFLEQLVT